MRLVASIEMDKMLTIPKGTLSLGPRLGMEDLTAASYDDVVGFFPQMLSAHPTPATS